MSFTKNFYLLACCALVLSLGQGCALTRFISGSGDDSAPDVAATYFDGPRVRVGIMLNITVMAVGTAAFDSNVYQVDADGNISLPLIGPVKCDGMKLIGLQQKICELYKKYYLEPQVTITFAYAPGQGMISPWGTVKVLGQVGREGPVDVPSTMDLTVTRALQLAGGTTALANKHNVLVTRCDKDGKQSQTKVDLVEMGEMGKGEMDMNLQAGDVVWVPMSWY